MKQVVEKAIESNTVRALTIWMLIGSSLLCALLYAYFVNKAIFQVVQTKHLISHNRTVSSDLNLLEQQYLGLQNTATLEKAHTLGLSETGTPLFISRKSLGKGISLRDEI